MNRRIRISHTVPFTKVLGPGNRYAVWTQGCLKKCRNCINPAGQKMDGGYEVTVKDIADDIIAQTGLQGVTISGGEPFLQFDALKELVSVVRSETDCDIMLYSGYRLQEIIDRLGEKQAYSFFSQIDIFIDGEYVDELDYGSIYRGSDNQQVYFFTGRYAALRDQICSAKCRDLEFELTKEGQVFMIGVPPKNFYQNFIKRIGDIKE